jgi:hypothetical protein
MPTDDYFERKDAMRREAQGSKPGTDSLLSKLPPSVEAETQKILQTVGDYAGVGAIGLGVASVLGAPVAGAAALGAGAISAGMYVAEGLTDARQGRTKEGATKVALGLLEAATTQRLNQPPPQILLSKSAAGRAAQTAKAYAPAARNIAYDVGINAAQDTMRDYANQTHDTALAMEMRDLASNPEKMRALAAKLNSTVDRDEDRDTDPEMGR